MLNLTYHEISPEDFEPLMAMASDWQVVRQLGRWKIGVSKLENAVTAVGRPYWSA